ncbi:MAG: hypothetical protein ACTSRG_10985 [Candidatus Helarchaeota archaeon]
MEKEKYYNFLFLSGAVWNFVVAFLCLIASIFIIDLSSLFGMQVPPSLFWYHLYFGFVFIFGLGYYLVSQDLRKNHGIVIMGIMEKYMVFIVALFYFILGHINILALFLVLIDLIYGCLFVEFLINYNKIN